MRECQHCGDAYEFLYGNQARGKGGQGGYRYCSMQCRAEAGTIYRRKYMRVLCASPDGRRLVDARVATYRRQNSSRYSLMRKRAYYRRKLEAMP